jgi:GNAT superfamily N-acetyltransferase
MGDAEPRRQMAVTTAAADWPDVERLFGVRGAPSRCWCRFFALTRPVVRVDPGAAESPAAGQVDGGAPAPGVLAFRAGNPGADQVWSVSCFEAAPGRRRTGVARPLLAAAVEHALAHGVVRLAPPRPGVVQKP